MKFPYLMLRDFVDTKLDAEQIGDLLTMAGFELEGIETVEGDQVLDIKVVSNRGDGLSVFGLAREVLAKDEGSHATELYQRATRRFDSDRVASISQEKRVPVTVETDDCTRYACALFEGVPQGDSPEWMRKRLMQAGHRPISLLVDLTNYVMLELGQPLHAFDRDKLEGPAIIVRQARSGENLTTLNGDEHELRPDQMMICDLHNPVAAAGVMGGQTSEVSNETRNVLLESAHFVNTSVRRTRKQLGLSTEASYRFERSVDPDGVVAALERFAELLAQVDEGKSRVPGVIDVYKQPPTIRSIELDVSRAEMLLGMAIGEALAIGYLERLGFHVTPGATLTVNPPSWRPDIVREEDLVEELGRVHGYEKIPEELPTGATVAGGAYGFEAWLDIVREACLRAGFQQAISHSLRDKGPLDQDDFELIGPRVPSSPDMAYLRNSLLPCLADGAKRNGGKDVHLFEMGKVFGKATGGILELYHLAFISIGNLDSVDWTQKESPAASFFTLKGSLEAVFERAGVPATFSSAGPADRRLHPTRQARITESGGLLGIIGQIHPDVADEVGLPLETILAELHLEPMFKGSQPIPRLRTISRNPAVRRDIAVMIDKSVPYEKIEAAIDRALGEQLEKRWLFDVYEGKGIPEGKHSLAIALQLRKLGGNFTDEEANQEREKAVEALAELGGTLR